MSCKVIILITIYFYIYSSVSCVRPACNKRCCDEAKVYNEKVRNRELCRLKCYLCYFLSMIHITVDASITGYLCNNSSINTQDNLDECLQKCHEIPPKGCKKECCDQRDMILTRRRDDPDACCEGHKHVNVDDINDEDVIDCRVSSSNCKDQGFLILYSDNSTVCVSKDSKSNGELGHDFGYSDECWQLDEYSSDPRKNFWTELQL
ncbi:SWPV1-206 [Shearwaterpox virus]|uniref:SWPV1-206 n=1 Tax=Shearwaterpox virus TaxID=1974596 RepID=A0A1V0S829_CNPV|nr:SWPV1-206 [Shearwaterpox virus]